MALTMNDTEIKIELVKAIEKQVWEANTGAEEADMLLHTLHEYEYFLVRQLAKKPTTNAHLADMRQAESDAQSLLIDLVAGEQDQMAGWQYGDTPENSAQALAGVLTLIHTELSVEIYDFMRLQF